MTSSGFSNFEISESLNDEAIKSDDARIDIREHHALSRIFVVLFGLGSISALFMPWMTFEVPLTGGTSVLYPWVFAGGRAFATMYVTLILVGTTLFVAGKRIGVLLVAAPAATVAWFALAVSIFGSVFHNLLGFLGSLAEAAMVVDTGDPGAWIRQGQGLTVATVCGLAVGVVAVLQFEPLCRTVWIAKNLFTSLLNAALLIILLVSAQSTWIIGTVVNRDVRIRVQGDQIFGSVIIDGLIWLTLGAWSLSVLSSYEGLRKTARIMTAIVALLRLAQCGFVLASASLLESTLPDSIVIGRHIDRLSGLYLTIAFSIVAIPLSLSATFPKRVRTIFWSGVCIFLCVGFVFAVVSN